MSPTGRHGNQNGYSQWMTNSTTTKMTQNTKAFGMWLVATVISNQLASPSQAMAKQSTLTQYEAPQPLMRLQSLSVVDAFQKPQVLSCGGWRV